jgi:hypothetical protein
VLWKKEKKLYFSVKFITNYSPIFSMSRQGCNRARNYSLEDALTQPDVVFLDSGVLHDLSSPRFSNRIIREGVHPNEILAETAALSRIKSYLQRGRNVWITRGVREELLELHRLYAEAEGRKSGDLQKELASVIEIMRVSPQNVDLDFDIFGASNTDKEIVADFLATMQKRNNRYKTGAVLTTDNHVVSAYDYCMRKTRKIQQEKLADRTSLFYVHKASGEITRKRFNLNVQGVRNDRKIFTNTLSLVRIAIEDRYELRHLPSKTMLWAHCEPGGSVYLTLKDDGDQFVDISNEGIEKILVKPKHREKAGKRGQTRTFYFNGVEEAATAVCSLSYEQLRRHPDIIERN